VSGWLPFRWHLVELAVIGVALAAHRIVVSDRALRRRALGALAALAVVVAWPVGDLAATVSLTAATVQRLVVMLLVAPMLLRATPMDVWDRLTRPAVVDAVVRRLSHPGVALAVVTIAGTATLTPPVVDWGARSTIGRDVVLVATLTVGALLWLPVIAAVPGTRRLSPVARSGYLVVSSLVVTAFSVVWIFARHPLYPGLSHQFAWLHLTPLADQQLAGFVAKFGAYVPMWLMAFAIFSTADRHEIPTEESPLHFADVQREMLRVDRQRARAARRDQGGTPSGR